MAERREKFIKLCADTLPGGRRLAFEEAAPALPDGWKGFRLVVVKPEGGGPYEPPLFHGVYRESGPERRAPVLEAAYCPLLKSLSGGDPLDFNSAGAQEDLFRRLADAVEPGETILFSCEGESEMHRLTREALRLGISPFFTPLGRLLEAGGFEWIEVWASCSGAQGREKKLWCEKPLQDGLGQARRERLACHFLAFLDQPSLVWGSPLIEAARKEAQARVKAMAVTDVALKERIERIE
jgi:hypothetical protein